MSRNSRKHHAYKKDYAHLYDNPYALFPGTGHEASRGAKVILWPNGQPAIWIQDDRGHGVEITAGAGPAGFGLHIRSFIGGNGITVSGNLADQHLTPHREPVDYKYIELTQYNLDEPSQAFKAWYMADHDDPDRPARQPDFQNGPIAGIRALQTDPCPE